VVAAVAVAAGVASARVAAAEAPFVPEDPPPLHRSLLGHAFTVGAVPVRGERPYAIGVALAYEHRLRAELRAFGQYEYLWLLAHDEADALTFDAAGHRALLGIRRTLAAAHALRRTVRFYVDAELGAGTMVVTERRLGALWRPLAFAGLRGGYAFDFGPSSRTGASRIWEPELFARAIVGEHGVGAMLGIGVGWGD
jgi:hypothetical protein